ncbi:hypothetical protein V2J09_022562 [Rumex salicifolius]
MDGVTRIGNAAGLGDQSQQPPQPLAPAKAVEKLNMAVQQQLNLDSIKTRAISLYKTISRILEDFDAMARSNAAPKWQDVLGQFSMVNLELFNIVEDIKKASKSFVVHPKNVNAENATILPVMLSSKLLPEMETDDVSKRELLLQGMHNLPVPLQIEKLKARIDMIAAACESAEKVLAETRKAYGLDTRQRMITLPTIDKTFAVKIQEQENLLRAAVNHGNGLRLPADQKQLTTTLPSHLVDVLNADGGQTHDASGMYMKNTPPMSSGNISNQGTPLQAFGSQLMGRSAPSPSGGSQTAIPFDNPSPLPYGNSPRSGTNMMNAPSPQQQTLQQHQQLQQQQQRQKLMQLATQQNQLPQLNDMQAQQKFQAGSQMQFSQPLASQQFQGRQLPTGHMQHGIGQSQLSQGSQLNRHMGQFSAPANNAMYNAAQSVPNTSMIANMSTTIPSQQFVPRMQFGLPGNAHRTHASQILSDQMFNVGVGNSGNVMPMQQQQQYASQGAFGSMPQNPQSLQPNVLQNTQQTHPNFQQQRQQNPQ